jgi:peroxiredoxin
MHDITKVNLRAVKKINKLAAEWQALGYPVWALTGSSSELAEKFRHEQQLSFPIHYGDDTQLKSIIRSNPGLVLFTDKSVVKETWPSTKLPKIKKLQKLTGK